MTVRRIRVRYFEPSDLNSIMEIERRCFEHPWTREELEAALKSDGVVAEVRGERILGFCIYSLDQDKITLFSIAVDPPSQRKGIGQMLISHVKEATSPKRPKIVSLVRETNMRAIQFLRKCGFVATNVVKCPYGQNTDEDGINFQFESEKLAPQEKVSRL